MALDAELPLGDEEIRRGLPSDWAVPVKEPERLSLPGNWKYILERYAGMGPSAPLDHILNETVGHEGPSIALLERDYIDADYRDEFAHFYARTYRAVPDRCERLHFFDERSDTNRYLGYIVLRPIIGRPVCRTVLLPPRDVAGCVSCVAPSSATPYGYPVRVHGFPFMSQDYQAGTCSHASIWMIAFYFHLAFRRPRYYISDLAGSARLHQDVLSSSPSGGLTTRQVVAVLHDLKMPPLIYRADRVLPHGETFESIACRYLDSRLPVLLLSHGEHEGHARVLIGYGTDSEGLFFVHHDDQRGPYLLERHLDRAGEWDALVVPLPGRIYLAGESAENTARLVFEETLERVSDLHDILTALQQDDLQLRSYVVETATYRRGLRQRGVPQDVFNWHVSASASHWLWVVELQDRAAAAEGRRCVLGELAVDATSDDRWTNPLFANLPGLLLRWPSLGDEIEENPSSQGREPYLSGCALRR